MKFKDKKLETGQMFKVWSERSRSSVGMQSWRKQEGCSQPGEALELRLEGN